MYALGACTSEPEPAISPEPTPPPPAYDLKRPAGGLSVPAERDDSFRRGVSLGLSVTNERPDARKQRYATFLDEAVALGATDLQLVVHWAQQDVESIEISPHPDVTVHDGLLGWVMHEAEERSLRVFLMPTLHVERTEEDPWRGTLSPRDVDRWWWSYRRFILHYARMAQANGAELFAVGSELRAQEGDEQRWRKLIKLVRHYFRGDVTYSSSWDRFDEVGFWDALDVVGVTAYAPLSKRADADDEALREGLAAFAKRVRSWAKAQDHHYLFTEVGYPAGSRAPVAPRDASGTGPVDVTTQLRCFRALYDVWQSDRRLSGLYIWNWFGEGDDQGTPYSPRGRPAEKVISHWFRESKPASDAPEVAKQ